MHTTGIRQITLGVGHLRRQVGFYGANFGLRAIEKGRVPASLARELWGVDEAIDMVVLGRPDLPDEARLRLIRTFDLPARPDFDPTVPGPLGVVFTTADIRRLYYRLSGAGAEFHSPPAEVAPSGDPGPGHPRFMAYGRAFDGEYLILAQPGDGVDGDGTPSAYFNVSEPREVCLVVPHLGPALAFAEAVFGFETLVRDRRHGARRGVAMGLADDAAFDFAMLRHPTSPGARLTLYSFGHGSLEATRPPARGLSAVRVECRDLDERLAAAETSGGLHLGGPVEVDEPVIGQGRMATVIAPFGLLVELWQPG